MSWTINENDQLVSLKAVLPRMADPYAWQSLATARMPYCPHCWNVERKAVYLERIVVLITINAQAQYVNKIECGECRGKMYLLHHPPTAKDIRAYGTFKGGPWLGGWSDDLYPTWATAPDRIAIALHVDTAVQLGNVLIRCPEYPLEPDSKTFVNTVAESLLVMAHAAPDDIRRRVADNIQYLYGERAPGIRFGPTRNPDVYVVAINTAPFKHQTRQMIAHWTDPNKVYGAASEKYGITTSQQVILADFWDVMLNRPYDNSWPAVMRDYPQLKEFDVVITPPPDAMLGYRALMSKLDSRILRKYHGIQI